MAAGPGLAAHVWRTRRTEAVIILTLTGLGVALQAGLVLLLALGIRIVVVDQLLYQHAGLAVAALLLVAALKAAALVLAIRLAEDLALRVQVDLAARLATAELVQVEQLGAATIQARLSTDVAAVASGGFALALVLQTLGLVASALVLLIVAAPDAAVLLLALLSITALMILRVDRATDAAGEAATAAESRLYESILRLLRAAKDLRLNVRRRDDYLASGLGPVRLHTRTVRAAFGRRLMMGIITFDAVFAFTVIIIGFLLPRIAGPLSVVLVLAVFLYFLDRIEFLSVDLPVVSAGSRALERLQRLAAALPPAVDPDGPQPQPRRFTALHLDHVSYTHAAETEAAFTVGPLSLTLEPGRIVFLVGGNGAGKSTLLRLITGLYPAAKGRITLDGAPASTAERQALCSAVFTDPHLFKKAYGLEPLDIDAARDWVATFRLGHVVEITADGLQPKAGLSTGQRKRLALIVALLEARPLLVLDEWTADQDPAFRERFFTELLPGLRAKGLAIVAATHDDQYRGWCDTVVRLERGRIIAVEPGDLARSAAGTQSPVDGEASP